MLSVLLFSTNLVINAQNLISNPGFENGMITWATNMNGGSNVDYSIETSDSPEGNQHIKCAVETLGQNDWDIQLRSNEFTVDESHEYQLTFKAKAGKTNAELKVYLQKNEWMGENFSLTDTWETYTYEFTPNEAIKQLKFNLTNVADYYIDDIVLEDKMPGSDIFNTPPSCVITYPHVNAYLKTGRDITINAYASDMGGSNLGGSVAKVEFFVDDEKIGESITPKDNTYSMMWSPKNNGEHRITSVATDDKGKSFTSAGVLVIAGSADEPSIGLSSGRGKYLGNVVRNDGVEATFTDYWNAVTSGNGGKWQTVERNRDVMTWTRGDEAYNLARQYHLPYRYHTIAWGSQYPEWIKTLNPSEFQEEMEEFIAAIAERYKYIDQIDVLNEVVPGHQADTKYFINGLGGAGESGYDWAVWVFKKSRQYFPNAKLVVNDFGIVNSQSSIQQQLSLLKVLRDSALVDGFGAQAHTFNMDYINAATLKQNLDYMSSAGVPIYITEMDMQGASNSESSQLSNYRNLFPVLWEHPAVAGITLWGYVYGNMWQPNAGLVEQDGTERTSMEWLREYMREQDFVGYPMSNGEPTAVNRNKRTVQNMVQVYPNPSNGRITLNNNSRDIQAIAIYDAFGRRVEDFTLQAGVMLEYNLSSGIYFVTIPHQETIKLLIQ